MRKLVSLFALTALFSVMALAESFSGKLLDESCYTQQKKAASCDATSATRSFALDVNGKVYKLNAEGNTKAGEAMRSHAERTNPNANPKEPNAKGQPGEPAPTMAKVQGTESNGTIDVESIQLQ